MLSNTIDPMSAIAAGDPARWPGLSRSSNAPHQAASPGARLTPREDQVLGLVGIGLTNRDIGRRLGIAEKTVKNTMTVIFAKLGLQRRAQAVIYVTVRRIAAEQGVVRHPE